MEPFPSTGGNVPVHHPKVGQPLTLKCASPNSYPKGIMSWALVDAASDVDKSLPFFKSSEFFQPLPLDARVAVDYSGTHVCIHCVVLISTSIVTIDVTIIRGALFFL
jgi:hypothetical protein